MIKTVKNSNLIREVYREKDYHLTWQVWRITPFFTSIFFILGIFTLYQVLFDRLKMFLHQNKWHFDESNINSWFGVLYVAAFTFGMQSTVVGKSISWEFMNFIVIGLIFCAYFLNIHIPYYYFVPLVLAYMIFNHSLFYWQSWCHAASVMVSYWTFQQIRQIHQDDHPFMSYMLTGIFGGAIMWYFVVIKFSLSFNTFIQQWSYLVVFELLLYSYVAMLLREDNQKSHLVEIANHDALTKAQNYAAYTSDIERFFYNSHRNKLNLSMMMFDIDDFKGVNDTYGHLAGDNILKCVVEKVQQVIDENDTQIKLYRTGGEEFNIIFPNYDLESTQEVVAEIVKAINDLTVTYEKNQIQITISVGISTLSKKDQQPNDFYGRVDANLYYSKRNGRNQITAV